MVDAVRAFSGGEGAVQAATTGLPALAGAPFKPPEDSGPWAPDAYELCIKLYGVLNVDITEGTVLLDFIIMCDWRDVGFWQQCQKLGMAELSKDAADAAFRETIPWVPKLTIANAYHRGIT